MNAINKIFLLFIISSSMLMYSCDDEYNDNGLQFTLTEPQNNTSSTDQQEKLIYEIKYSDYSSFPFYVMDYIPEWVDGVMTDYGANYKYEPTGYEAAEGETIVGTTTTAGGAVYDKVQLASPGWHQYFFVIGIPTELDGVYTVKALCRASEACSINCNMQWSWDSGCNVGATVNIGTEWQEVEWEYSGINGTSCDLIMQPGDCTATIEWKYVKIYQEVKWEELLINGNAETAWGKLSQIAWNDIDNNTKICAWAKEYGVNVVDDDNRPFPATIEYENSLGNHCFVVHANDCPLPYTEASTWANQFWIQTPRSWEAGTVAKISFRYRASRDCSVATQVHKQCPTEYLYYEALGDINFTTSWQEYEKAFSIKDDQVGAYSVAFMLNSDTKLATDFYFDDISFKVISFE